MTCGHERERVWTNNTMTFDVYDSLTKPNEYKYKLIKLPKDLLEYIKNDPKRPLHFKSPSAVNNHLVICSDSATYSVRQMNHSNTQLLLNDMAINKFGFELDTNGQSAPSLVAIGSATYQYELSRTEGHIDTNGLPIVEKESDCLQAHKSLEDIRGDSPIADNCFFPKWYALCGSEIDGKAVILGPNLTTDTLHTIITIQIAQKLSSFSLEQMVELASKQDKKFTPKIVETVVNKFGTKTDGHFSLSSKEVARWFGIQTLRRKTKFPNEKELLIEWKASLPPFHNASLDLRLLQGTFYREGPNKICFLASEALSMDLHSRIKMMFSLAKEWDYEEFLPYVTDFIPAGKKPDAIIVKYAKKKRVGKNYVVCPR